jgi:serine protease DegS
MNVRFTLPYVTAGVLIGGLWWAWSSDFRLVEGAEQAPKVSEKPPASPSAPVLSYNAAVMRAAPAVVSVYASRAPESSDTASPATSRVQTTQGSGVVVAADGIVVTNRHIVEGADIINVALADGRLHPASMIGNDPATDVAVLQIPVTGLPYLSLDTGPVLRVGDVVLAIGNPFGVGQTVTQGIVSATRRRVANASPWQNFIQIDAAINPGNSGGALINPAGELVGVNAAVFRRTDGSTAGSLPPAETDDYDVTAQGIGFAIPATLLAEVVPDIVQFGRVARGWLGIAADDLAVFPRLAERLNRSAGAVITDITPSGPGQLHGLQAGDVVVAANGLSIESANDLLLAISSSKPNSVSQLSLYRDERLQDIAVTLGERANGFENAQE